MTSEEVKEIKCKIHKGMDMILDKAEQIGRSEEKWILEEVMYMSDITKDMSETLKNLAKTNYYLSEHSIKRY